MSGEVRRRYLRRARPHGGPAHLDFAATEEKMMLNWITHNPDAAFAIVTTIGAWLYHKARGQKTDDLWDTALKLGKQVLPKLMQDARLYDDAYVNAEIRKAIVAGLSRLKLKLPDALIDEAVEHIHGELAEQVMAHNLGRYIEVSSKTVAEMK